MGSILSAHLTHKRSRMSELENIARKSPSELLSIISNMPGVLECAVLKTCNRVEFYTVTNDVGVTKDALERTIGAMLSFDASQNATLYLKDLNSVSHLLRVASGLDSMVLGEDQILGQVKDAYELALSERHIGPRLSVVFRGAISTGKKVRTETRISKGEVSIGSTAVRMAETCIGSLEGKNILILGGGEMASLIAKHLVDRNPNTVFVSNRTYSRAVELAWELNGRAVNFDGMVDHMAQCDVVLCATSATHMILVKEQVERAMEDRGGRDLLIIDVSFPRNVSPDVSDVPGVRLYDIDGLREQAEENIKRRRNEIRDAERIIAAELESLHMRFNEMHADAIISQMYQKYNLMREREVNKALNRLAAGHEPVEIVLEDLASALMNKFLFEPTTALKEASREGNMDKLLMVGEMFRMIGESHVSRDQAPKIEVESHD
ncbi:MAG: glutamyl-tRNA reductase [Euryarchaeota archaeon]|nr:glutamyl-tRNA reductase [Euryarchaeota archaeon]